MSLILTKLCVQHSEMGHPANDVEMRSSSVQEWSQRKSMSSTGVSFFSFSLGRKGGIGGDGEKPEKRGKVVENGV